MNRKRIVLFSAAAIVLLLIGYRFLGNAGQKDEVFVPFEKTVKTMTVEAVSRPILLEYIGTVDSKKNLSLGFKNGGKLKSVLVKKGDAVKPGTLLALQDATDYRLASEASSAQSGTQRALLEKAENALSYTEKQFARIEALHREQAVSDSEYEQALLELELRRHEVQAANQTLAQTAAQVNLSQNALSDTRLNSPVAGYVAEVPFDAGEIVGDGIPVVILRSKQQLIRFGVSQKDLPQIVLGMKARVDVDSITDEGIVTSIAQVPNPQTRTYLVEILTTLNTYPIGAVGKVTLLGPEEQGILIPIECVQSNTVSYVYVVKSNVVTKKEVVLQKPEGAMVFATGIDPGDVLIVEGMKRVQAGDRVLTMKGGD